MSRSVAISVEGLSKRYLVGHNAPSADRNATLRDGIVNGAKDLARKTRDMLSGRQIVQGDSVEEFWALRDVSFEIPKGSRVGILGRNGAGKSTLLKLLSRITEPTSGQIKINGRVASLLEVGTGFHPELSGRENIFLNGAILGMSRREIQAKFDEIVAFSEVERFLDTPVKRYSSGMYVRLAFAVAAHLEPEILIVDEVLAVGDVQFQQKCLGKMESVGREGRTVLFVSHNLTAMQALCDTAILLSSGQVSSIGSVTEMVTRYFSDTGVQRSLTAVLVSGNFAIHDIRLCDSKGAALQLIDTDTDVYVEIHYSVKVEGRLNMCLSLRRGGEFVFQSTNNLDNWYARAKMPGEYVTRCTIPAKLLNDGRYSFGITVFEENYSNPKDFLDVIAVDIADGASVRADYFGGIRGVVRPALEWNTLKVSETSK